MSNNEHDFGAEDEMDNLGFLQYPMEASTLRENGFCNINGRPCKIKSITKKDVGKGRTLKITGIDIFTDETLELEKQSGEIIGVPNVSRVNWKLEYFEDDNLVLSPPSEEPTETKTIKIPSGQIGNDIRALQETNWTGPDHYVLVTLLQAMGQEAIIETKEQRGKF